MAFLLRSFLSAIIEFFMEIIFQVQVFVLDLFNNQFGYNTKMFHDIVDPTGSILPTVLDIFKWTGFGLILVFFAWNLWRVMFAPITEVRVNPVALIGRFLIALFVVWMIYEILTTVVLNMFVIPHRIIESLKLPSISDMSDWWSKANSGGGIESFFSELLALTTWTGFVAKIIPMLLFGTCSIIFLTKMVKLVVEMVERYLLMNILVYSSPLAAATLASPSMSSIFSGWAKMLGGQMILIMFNALSMKLIMGAYASVGGKIASDGGGLENGFSSLIFGFVTLFALLNIAQRFDTYLNQIGINAGITGNSLIQGDTGILKSMANTVKSAAKSGESGKGPSLGGTGKGESPDNPAKINKGSVTTKSPSGTNSGNSTDSSSGQKITVGGSQSIFGTPKHQSKEERAESQKARANDWLAKQNESEVSSISNNADLSGGYEYTDADAPLCYGDEGSDPMSINDNGYANDSTEITSSINSIGGLYSSSSSENTCSGGSYSSSSSENTSIANVTNSENNSAMQIGATETIGSNTGTNNYSGNTQTLNGKNSSSDAFSINQGGDTINNSPNLTKDKPMNNPYVNRDKANNTSAKVFRKKDGN